MADARDRGGGPGPLILAGGFAIATALLLLPLPIPDTRFWSTVENLGHVLLFGAASWVVSQRRDSLSPAACVLLVGAGAASELLQLATGRDASWQDLGFDVLGIAAAVSAHIAIRHRRRGATVFAAACIVMAVAPTAWSCWCYWSQWSRFPVLFRYSTPADLYFIERSGTTDRYVGRERCGPPAPGALRVKLAAAPFAGILMRELVGDWHDWDTLEIRVATLSLRSVMLTVRIHDEQHDWTYEDRYNAAYEVPPGKPVLIRIPLEAIRKGPANGRSLDLSRVAGLALFRADTGPAQDICLDYVTLSRSQH